MSHPPELLSAGNVAITAAAGSTEVKVTEAKAAEAKLTEAMPSEPLRAVEETLRVSKRDVVTGAVRVSLRTEVIQETADITLERTVAEVTRVPVGRLVDAPPSVRTEGDVTIVPVLEERYVVVKQLYLTEELHIRHEIQQVVSHSVVPLRRQTATIERLDADAGVVVDEPDLQS